MLHRSTNQTLGQIRKNRLDYQKKFRKSSKKVIKHVKRNHHFAVQAMLLIAIGSLFILTRQSGSKPSVSYNSGFGGAIANSTVDEVASAGVAATIARQANMIVADNVNNLADSLNAQVEFATSHDSYLAKPQLVATEAKTRSDITTYVAKKGDSISSVAQKFNITSDSIRWANDITGEALGEGVKLTIPPISGLIYRVEEGDTPASLAERYNANKSQIIAFNDAEVDGLPVGERIIIPNGVKPQPQPVYRTTVTNYGFAFGSEAQYGGNGYSYGYCTWHAANRRAQIGKPLPTNLGNAVTWASLAAQAGLGVGEEPAAGAVLWHKDTWIAGGFGHVGFVESLNPDGSITVSDMNYPIWNGITTRTIQPNEFSNFLFIY